MKTHAPYSLSPPFLAGLDLHALNNLCLSYALEVRLATTDEATDAAAQRLAQVGDERRRRLEEKPSAVVVPTRLSVAERVQVQQWRRNAQGDGRPMAATIIALCELVQRLSGEVAV